MATARAPDRDPGRRRRRVGRAAEDEGARGFSRAGILLLVGVVLWALERWLHGRHVDACATAQIEVVEGRHLR